MLERLGYRVTARRTPGGPGAFRKEPDAFDLVITDQTMPHLTGVELAREILRIRPSMPIILCTGFSISRREGGPGGGDPAIPDEALLPSGDGGGHQPGVEERLGAGGIRGSRYSGSQLTICRAAAPAAGGSKFVRTMTR